MKPPCPACGFIHASTDARGVGLFSGLLPSFVAANAGTPARATRAEAEADECAWRQRRSLEKTLAADTPSAAPAIERVAAAPAPPPQAFPAVAMEEAARAKAWCDFLTHARMSLMVWEVDGEVREGCEHVLAWIGRCRDDLAFGARP